jgi:hypothetical protein
VAPSVDFFIANTSTLQLFFRERLRKKIHLKFSVAKKFCVDLLDGSLSPGMPALVTAEEKLPA